MKTKNTDVIFVLCAKHIVGIRVVIVEKLLRLEADIFIYHKNMCN
jgi:hypothetical protein